MSRLSFNNWIHILRLLWAILPSFIVIATLAVVLFGDQGLIARSHFKQLLHETRLDNETIQQENHELSLQIRRLKTGKKQLELLAADKLLNAVPNATIYRFHEEGEQ